MIRSKEEEKNMRFPERADPLWKDQLITDHIRQYPLTTMAQIIDMWAGEFQLKGTLDEKTVAGIFRLYPRLARLVEQLDSLGIRDIITPAKRKTR